MKKRFITHPLRNTEALITLPRHTCVHTVKGSAVTQSLRNRVSVWVLGSRSAKTNALSPSRSSGRTLFPVCMMVRSHTIKDFNKSGFASESNSQPSLLEGAHRQKRQPPSLIPKTGYKPERRSNTQPEKSPCSRCSVSRFQSTQRTKYSRLKQLRGDVTSTLLLLLPPRLEEQRHSIPADSSEQLQFHDSNMSSHLGTADSNDLDSSPFSLPASTQPEQPHELTVGHSASQAA